MLKKSSLVLGFCLFAFAGWQAQTTPEALRLEANEAFASEDWALAHQRFAELLSIDGTDPGLQMKYAATLLHDLRSRPEGVQRLASLDHEGRLGPEGLYWWGVALMMEGEKKLASDAFELALLGLDKKDIWHSQAELALAQSLVLPNEFDSLQGLTHLAQLDVPVLSFYRFVNWGQQDTRIMLVPDELRTKKDRKAEMLAPVAFQRGGRQLIYHSLGSKSESGTDLWVAELSPFGEFLNPVKLPETVNSPHEDINPVWDVASQCLYFASNRPGTLGGYDVFSACMSDGVWSPAKPLPPSYNSIADDWAYYPHHPNFSGWIVTNREGEFGSCQVWEVLPDGPAKLPVELTTKWSMDEGVLPGELTVSDAKTSQVLARMSVNSNSGSWDLVAAAGQVLNYTYRGENGTVIEGIYALPEAHAPSKLAQDLVLRQTAGQLFLEANPLVHRAEEQEGLKWSWQAITQRPVQIQIRERMDVEESASAELPARVRPVVQFQSYPWWTEEQKMERALAAHQLSEYVPKAADGDIRPEDFNSNAAYAQAVIDRQEWVKEQAMMSVLALASLAVLEEEVPWSEAVKSSLNEASRIWPVGTINVEEVGRLAQRRWAEMGILYDEGILPEVRDKQGLIDDGSWIREPWANGEMRALAQIFRANIEAGDETTVVWSLAQMIEQDPEWRDAFDNQWLELDRWNTALFRQTLDSAMIAQQHGIDQQLVAEEAESEIVGLLEEVRQRMGILDAIQANQSQQDSHVDSILREWQIIAIELNQHLEEKQDNENRAHGGDSFSLRRDSGQNALDQLERADVPSSEHVEDASTKESAKTELQWQASWAEDWQKALDAYADIVMAKSPDSDVFPEGFGQISDDHNSDHVASWRTKFYSWVRQFGIEHEHGPLAGLESLQGLMQLEIANLNPVQQKARLAFAKQVSEELDRCQHEFEREASSNEALNWMEYAWMCTQWATDSIWMLTPPELMPDLLGQDLPGAEEAQVELSILWAKLRQNEPESMAMDSTDSTALKPVEDTKEQKGASALEDEANAQSPTQDQALSDTATSIEQDRHVGDRGLHLGWFRNQPEFGSLPEGAVLTAEVGKNGLTRWVLVFADDGEFNGLVEDVYEWLVSRGVSDAYEVFWHGEGWDKEESRPVMPRDASDHQEMPDGATSANVEAWGGDDLWEHGAPVELGNLRGVWYAVQVGAFRGNPEKDWIEQAGERLVYEPFQDGLARWYAGVRQDEASARERLNALRSTPLFADAFLVRLSRGVREVVPPGGFQTDAISMVNETPQDVDSDDNTERSQEKKEVSRTSQNSVDEPIINTESGMEIADGVADDMSVQEAVALPFAPEPEKGSSSWHIDIARYYGTVPSADVSVLLFKAAEWEVRSVELFGQTTYYTKSLTDLDKASQLLDEVQKAGFIHAQLIKDAR